MGKEHVVKRKRMGGWVGGCGGTPGIRWAYGGFSFLFYFSFQF